MAKRRKKSEVSEEPTSTAVMEPAPAPAAPDTVTVALNRAQGVQFRMPDGRTVEIAGSSVHLAGGARGALPVGAYGLTPGVRSDDWEWIRKTYAGTALFRSGRIFASSDSARAADEAREKAELRNGLEPASPVQTEEAGKE